ncbi:hypothetical protein K458DRAFT_488921 [Lentithecium fluviatile CBS 122367]|uniref:Uncharacterized protein n=1 Tax=Lentithecium fluviatile CBS 122367 TaxID=1168545 RepID=A0A6G1IVI4_9PLEO|nr:hypothetical protein K458DRAFT_488921 [Lentithecium fluviatile CBS 122367]
MASIGLATGKERCISWCLKENWLCTKLSCLSKKFGSLRDISAAFHHPSLAPAQPTTQISTATIYSHFTSSSAVFTASAQIYQHKTTFAPFLSRSAPLRNMALTQSSGNTAMCSPRMATAPGVTPPAAKSDDDELAEFQAIRDGTLTDEQALKNLRYRRANFLEHTKWTPQQWANGKKIYDRAIDNEVPKALRNGTPLVKVLRAASMAIGEMAWGAGERVFGGMVYKDLPRDHFNTSTAPVHIAPPSVFTGYAVPPPGTLPHKRAPSPNLEESIRHSKRTKAGLNQTPSLYSESSSKVSPGYEGRELESNQAKTGAEINAVSSFSNITIHETKAELLVSAAESKKRADELRAKLAQMNMNMNMNMEQNRDKTPPSARSTWSSAFVPPPSGKGQHGSKRGRPSLKPVVDLILIVKLPVDFSKLPFAVGEQRTQHLTAKTSIVLTEAKDSSTVAHPEVNDTTTHAKNQNAAPHAKTKSAIGTSEPPAHDSPSNISMTSTIPVPTHALPPFPPLLHKEVTPFTRGITLALENIAADHVTDPTVTLLDLIVSLEISLPTVDDWERKTVVHGNEFVYEALSALCEDAREEGKDIQGPEVKEIVKEFLAHASMEEELMRGRLEKGGKVRGVWGERSWVKT